MNNAQINKEQINSKNYPFSWQEGSVDRNKEHIEIKYKYTPAPLTPEKRKELLEKIEKSEKEMKNIPPEKRIPVSNPDKYSFPIGFDDQGKPFPVEKDILVALVAPPKDNVFYVQFLIQPDSSENKQALEDVKEELNYYLMDKHEKNPWGYAIHHCGTASNIYSKVHWGYFNRELETLIKARANRKLEIKELNGSHVATVGQYNIDGFPYIVDIDKSYWGDFSDKLREKFYEIAGKPIKLKGGYKDTEGNFITTAKILKPDRDHDYLDALADEIMRKKIIINGHRIVANILRDNEPKQK